MEDITTQVALEYLAKRFKSDPTYKDGWIKVMVEGLADQMVGGKAYYDKDSVLDMAKIAAENFIDFLIKEYITE